ncbi:hypothetical protein N9E27_00370 [Planktomarina temperata]|nr:hypothetical protein [Planktomarina temperata]
MTIQQHASFDSSAAELNATSKLVKAWESKNAKNAARAGGVSLMALSLAACGGSDDAAVVVPVDITSDNAEILLAAVTAVDATATTVAEVAANANAAGVTAGETAADAGIRESIADAGITVAADATSAEMIAAVAASDNTAVMMSQADFDAAIDAADDAEQATIDATNASVTGAGFADVDALIAAYTTLVAPVTQEMSTAATDVFNGGTGSDSITATDLTLNAGDIITDASSTDADSLTISVDNADLAATAIVAGIETLTVNVTSVLAGTTPLELSMDLANYSGLNTVNVNATNAATLVNALQLNNADSATINADTEFATVTLAADNNATFTVNAFQNVTANAATGNVDGLTVTTTATTGTATIGTDADGTVVVNTAGDTTVTADDAANVTVTSAANANVNASDANANAVTVTAGEEAIVTANNAETVTISAGDGIDAASATAIASSLTSSNTSAITANLSGNGAAASFDLTGATTVNNVAISGDQNVTVQMSMATVDGLGASTSATADDNIVTISDTSTGTSTLSFTATGGDVDTSAAAVDVVGIAAALAGTETITVASGTSLSVTGGTDLTNLLTIAAKVPTATDNSVSVTIVDDATLAASGDFAAVTLNNFATATLTAGDTSTASDIDNIIASGTDLTLALGARGFSTPGTVALGTGDLTITGSAAIDFSTNGITAGSVDAGASTGAVTLDLIGAGTVGTVTTGSGNDDIDMTTAARTAGDYTIVMGAGTDSLDVAVDEGFTVDMGAGTDTITFSGGARDFSAQTVSMAGVEAITNAANVTLTAAAFVTDNIFSKAGAGTLIVTGTANSDNVDASNVVVTAGGITINGGASADTLIGAATATAINGGDGNDTITGGAGADTIDGGNGNDTISTGAGGGAVGGAAGNDTITGGAGADTITGGAGADTMSGGEAGDTYVVNTGEVISGESIVEAATATGTDTVRIDSTTDLTAMTAASFDNIEAITFNGDFSATATSAQLTGETLVVNGDGAGNADVLTINVGIGETGVFTGLTVANAGLVAIEGATGGETITAAAAGGTIDAGTGNDTITGGAGTDVIRYTESDGSDVINTFTSATDVFDISVSLIADDSTATNLTGYSGTNDVAASQYLVLDNTDLAAATGIALGADVILEIGSGVAVTTGDHSATSFHTAFDTVLDVGTANDQGKLIFIAYNGTTAAADAGVYLVDFSTATGATKALEAGDSVTLLATFDAIGADTLVAADFL